MENHQIQKMRKLEIDETEIESMDNDDDNAEVEGLINLGTFVVTESDDLSPGERVLDIDHLIEEILDSLDISTLLSCRLVSRRFMFMVEIRLKKLLRIEFKNYEKQTKADLSTKLLSDLTSVLRTSDSDSSGSSFPCRKFSFTDTICKDNFVLKKFLEVQGAHIDELSLSYSGYACDEGNQLARLCTRVLCHTPNLQSFSFECESYANQFQEYLLHKQVEKVTHLEKLKKVNIQGAKLRLPSGILEVMTKLSPNLEEIIFGGDPSPLGRSHQLGFLQHLIKINRPFLLTKVDFDLFPEAISSIRTLILEAERLKKPLKLREITFFREVDYESEHENVALDIPTMLLVSKILGSSSNSLETITLTLTEEVSLEGIIWPEKMPNVTKVVLELKLWAHSVDFNGEPVERIRFFPTEFDFRGIFPSLQEVHCVVQDPVSCDKFMDILDIDGGPLIPTMPKVKVVKFRGHNLQLSKACLERVKSLWPAATLSY